MDVFKQSKILKVMFIIFIVFSLVHVLYASFSFRGLYCDGSYYMLRQLKQLSSGIYQIAYDEGHPRFFILLLTQLPVMISHSLLFIKNKFALMFIYSFFQFAIPLASLFWSYKLAKRTEKIDIFFWNLITYGGIILLYKIFSVTESIQGISFHFLLWNYLTAKIDYNKKDIFFILLLIILMFGTYEYIAYLGIFFFLCHFYYVFQEASLKNQFVKTVIGFGSLSASIYTIWFMSNQQGESGEIFRFLGEGINVIPQMSHLNSLITIFAFILLIVLAFQKTKIKNFEMYIAAFVLFFALGYLLQNLDASLVPMWEQHFRVFPCIWLMFVFLCLHLKDIMKPEYNFIRWHNLLCIALLLVSFQTLWQINNTFYWNKNIQYMKRELAKSNSPLYIPKQHKEISNFMNEDLRRYIWHSVYPVTSILFSDTYKQKTLLLNYDDIHQEGNLTFRHLLYVPKNSIKISLPFGIYADIKNDYWDLTDCAKALDEYNKKHKIKTNG